MGPQILISEIFRSWYLGTFFIYLLVIMKKCINRKIGVIGGVGPQATSVLYSEIMKFAQKKYKAKDNDDYPYVVFESVPIPDFISDKEQIDEALEMLKVTVENLEKAKCSRLCIASNTVHLLLKDLQKDTDVEFLSMLELVAEKVCNLGFRKVGLVGSSVILGSGLYSKVLAKYNIDLILPKKEDRVIIDKIIRYVLSGEDNGRERKAYINILNHLIKEGAEGIILGCTELPLAINYEALGERVINSTEVLAEGIADYYYS